ncbi:hypothetical protein ACF0H5_006450 [Mactra antiquata]
MASKCSPFLWGIVGLATVTLIFHLIGFVTPGWLVMKRTINETPRHIGGHFVDDDIFSLGEAMFFRDSRGEDGEQKSLPIEDREESDLDDRPHRPDGSHPEPHHDGPHHRSSDHPHHSTDRPHHPSDRPHHGSHHRPHHDSSSEDSSKSSDGESKRQWSGKSDDSSDEFDKDIMSDKQAIVDWMRMKKDEYNGAEIQTSYGLWYSKVCVRPSEKKMMHKRLARFDHDTEWNKDEGHGKEWEKSGEMDHEMSGKSHHKRGQCKKICTKTALYFSYIYESPEQMGRNKRTIDYKKVAFTCLLEHQIEASLGLGFIVLGLLGAFFGFRDTKRCKYCAYGSIVFMLLASFVTLVPVSRFAHYSMHKHHEKFPVYVHAPYSVIASGLSAILAFCTALVCVAALIISSRKSKNVTWKQFENDQEPEKKNQQLVFYNDQFPVKPGLYDVCDFSDIKPVEEKTMNLAEPNKTQI